MLQNYERKNIQPCSYDVRLGEIFRHKACVVDEQNQPEIEGLKLPYLLKPGEFILARSMERFDMPLDIMGLFKTKSTAFRIGLNILVGIADPGYKGAIVFGVQNISKNTVKLSKGVSLVQACFIGLKGNAIPIETKYMGGKIL